MAGEDPKRGRRKKGPEEEKKPTPRQRIRKKHPPQIRQRRIGGRPPGSTKKEKKRAPTRRPVQTTNPSPLYLYPAASQSHPHHKHNHPKPRHSPAPAPPTTSYRPAAPHAEPDPAAHLPRSLFNRRLVPSSASNRSSPSPTRSTVPCSPFRSITISIQSPSNTFPIGPPASASGEICPTQAPVDTPLNRASVSTATCLQNGRLFNAEVI